jgi:hypothetical protein
MRLSLSPFRDLAHDRVSDADAINVFSALAAIKKPGVTGRVVSQAVVVQDLVAADLLGFDPVEPLSRSGYFLISPENQSPPRFREIPLPPSVLGPGDDG